MIISTSWGVLVARHQQIKAVQEALVWRGVDHFIPMIETLLIVHGRHVREQRPLLGEYVLISISSIWKSLLRIRSVAGVLLNESGMPAQVLQSEVIRMHEMCDDCGVYKSSSVIEKGGFEYGQRVTPKDGPFAFHVGTYHWKTKKGDEAVFQLFGQDQKVTFKSGDLLAV